MRTRVIVALAIGLVSAVLCFGYQSAFARGAGDIAWPRCAALALMDGRDPYACEARMSTGLPGPTNPLTTVITILPLAVLPPEMAAAVFFGLSSALLAFGLTPHGAWWRLMVFLALPYWAALQTVQWSPLLFAVALYPVLAPLALAKPHVGLAVLLPRLTPLRVAACAVVGLSTLLLDPDWLWRWLSQLSPYDGFIPLLTLPGLLLLLLLPYWRDRTVQTCLLLALAPQRLFYDQLLVWLIPQTRREMLLMVAGSWLCYLLLPVVGISAPTWTVIAIYLPAGGLLLRRHYTASHVAPSASPA